MTDRNKGMITGAVFFISLVVVVGIGEFWPGILIVFGLTGAVNELLRGRLPLALFQGVMTVIVAALHYAFQADGLIVLLALIIGMIGTHWLRTRMAPATPDQAPDMSAMEERAPEIMSTIGDALSKAGASISEASAKAQETTAAEKEKGTDDEAPEPDTRDKG